MKVTLRVNRLLCNIPTENNILNDRDEVYFVIGGVAAQNKITVPRLSPPPPEDYYGLHAGEYADNIVLWSGQLNDGESASLLVLAREQDNAQFGAIEEAIKGAIETAFGYLTGNSGIEKQGLQDLAKAAADLAGSISKDGDQTLGTFVARIRVDAGCVIVDYGSGDISTTAIPLVTNTSARFHAVGGGSDYTISMEVPVTAASYTGIYGAGNDGYALWNSAESDFLSYYDKASTQGLRLSSLTSYVENSARYFVGTYRSGSDAHDLVFNADWQDFSSAVNTRFQQGLRLANMTTYLTNGNRLFAGTFRAGTGAESVSPAFEWDAFSKLWTDLSGRGQRLVNIITWKDGAKRHYSGIFHPGTDAYALHVGLDWDGLVAKWKDLSAKGLRLIDITSFHDAGKHQYAAVFRGGNGGYALYGAHWKDFATNWQTSSKEGLRLLDVAVQAPTAST